MIVANFYYTLIPAVFKIDMADEPRENQESQSTDENRESDETMKRETMKSIKYTGLSCVLQECCGE